LFNQPLNPHTTRVIIFAVLVVVVILGLLTAVWLTLNPRGPTFAFTKSDEFTITGVVFGGISSNATNYINMTIQNIGSSPWTLTNTAQVNSATSLTVSSTYGLTCAQGYSITIKIANVNWISGNQYSITLLLTDGNKITYFATAAPGGHSPNPNPNPNNIPSVPSPTPPSPIAMFVTDNPLIVASFIAIAEIVVLVVVFVYFRVRAQHNVSTSANPLKPPSILLSDDMIILAALMIFCVACITFYLVLSYLTPPLTFSLHLGF
jgi:hypothetical protein